MKSSKPTIRLKITPSKKLAAILIAIHATALTATLWYYYPLWLKILLTIIITIHFIYYWKKEIQLNTKNSITEIEANEKNWQLTTAKGKKIQTEIQPGTVITAQILILKFKTPETKKTNTIVLIQNKQNAEKHRQLRVMLNQLTFHPPTVKDKSAKR